MSKLTSFTSASDALIQPTGATNGQTLIWNATSEQFEPTNPPTSGLKVWTTSTAYAAGELVVFAFGFPPEESAAPVEKFISIRFLVSVN